MSEVVRWNAEDASVYMALTTGDYVLYVDHERSMAEARAAALRDAVQAVKALPDDWERGYATEWERGLFHAVAAIEALGGER